MLSDYLLPGIPVIEGPFFDDSLMDLPEDYRRIAIDLNRKGYSVFDFPDPSIFEKMDGIKRDLRSQYDWEAWKAGKIEGLRLQDGWRTDERVRDIATNASVLKMLSALYGRQAFPFQTLNFAVGTQQAAHADYPHFNSIPDRFMCGVWLAFEDTDDDNGPLFYYPGSHKWPTFQNEHLGVPHTQISDVLPNYLQYVELWERLAQKQGLKKEVFRAKKGQALIWASNLVHGGSPQRDLSRTRWSQVTHYFFEGCGYTTPLANDTFQGKILFRDVLDVRTGKPVPNVISGERVDHRFQESARPALPEHSDEAARKGMSRYRFHPDLPRDFDPVFYLATYPDLAAVRVEPYHHYIHFGKSEGRRYKPG